MAHRRLTEGPPDRATAEPGQGRFVEVLLWSANTALMTR
jgi:hypothetical protein